MQTDRNPYIAISILLRGDELNPDYVSEVLGIQPDKSQRKGEKRGGTRPNSKTYVTKIGTWWIGVNKKLRAEQHMISEVPQMIEELFKMLEGRQEALPSIRGVDEAYLDILILVNKQREDKLDLSAEFILRNNQILRMSQLGLGICSTISYNGTD